MGFFFHVVGLRRVAAYLAFLAWVLLASLPLMRLWSGARLQHERQNTISDKAVGEESSLPTLA